uniref:hypothetical protein n=1 Tax=Lachnoclostridium phocaeense TaxID=1871021 RepID=UPI0026DBF647|nr:hypothetical protein [Lachnoclostridium phocaeense]
MNMRKVCPCGGAEFKATRIFQADVICDGTGKPINHIGFYEDHTTGPYTCKKCGAQYESLEDLVTINQYITVGFPGKTPTKLSVASDGSILKNVKEAIVGFYKALGNDLSKTEGIHPVCVDNGEETVLYGLLCVEPDRVSIKLGSMEEGMSSEWQPVPLDESEESGIHNQYQCKEVLLSMEALAHRELLCGVKVVEDCKKDQFICIIKPGGYIFYCPSVVRAKTLAEAGSFIAVDIPNDADYTFMFTKEEFEEAVITYKGTGRFASDLWSNYDLHKRYYAMKDHLDNNPSYGEWLEGYLNAGILAPIEGEDVEAVDREVYSSKRAIDRERILTLMAPEPKKVKLSMQALAKLTLTYGGFFVYDKASDRYSFKYLSEEEDPEKWFSSVTWAKVIEEETDKVRLLLENTRGDYLIDLLLTPKEFEESLHRFIY